MEFEKIISITGKPGLYELLSTRADGVVVRSLEDQSKKFASNRQHQFSHLDSIEIYTTGENATLRDVLTAMKNAGTEIPDSKADGKTLQAYFDEVYPGMDFERVFNSDLKKLIKWLHTLDEHEVDFVLAEDKKEEAEPEVKVEEKSEEIPPAKKTAKKKTATKATKTKKKED